MFCEKKTVLFTSPIILLAPALLRISVLFLNLCSGTLSFTIKLNKKILVESHKKYGKL